MRQVDCGVLPTIIKGGKECIDWSSSIGYTIPFVYDNISGSLLVLEYIKKGSMVRLKYNNEEWIIKTQSLKHSKIGGKLKKTSSDFKYNTGETFNDGKILIIDRQYRQKKDKNGYNSNMKYYKYKCLVCGWDEGWIDQYSLANGGGCSCCNGKTVVEGINDIPTTTPWMVKYFQGGYNEAKNYTSRSNKKIYPICPECRQVKDKPMSIGQLFNQGLGCKCGDGFSYSEKFVRQLLSHILVEHIVEYTPPWSQGRRYDFHIPSLNMIIETHGLQHYKESNRGRSFKEEHENDLLKFDLSVINGIEHYVVLDCRHSNPDWIKNSIMSSKLPELLGFKEEDIDWVECDKCSQANLVKEVCDYKRNNPHMTTGDLAKMFNSNATRMREYLIIGSGFGWCTYNPKLEKSRVSAKNVKIMNEKRKGR